MDDKETIRMKALRDKVLGGVPSLLDLGLESLQGVKADVIKGRNSMSQLYYFTKKACADEVYKKECEKYIIQKFRQMAEDLKHSNYDKIVVTVGLTKDKPNVIKEPPAGL